jgi:hypothetical protein
VRATALAIAGLAVGSTPIDQLVALEPGIFAALKEQPIYKPQQAQQIQSETHIREDHHAGTIGGTALSL